jgi:hypothetical protein
MYVPGSRFRKKYVCPAPTRVSALRSTAESKKPSSLTSM